MSADTLIQWCHATVNFWWGCTKVSGGCAHCYAEKMAKRLGRGRASWGPEGLRWLRVGEACFELLQLNRRAEKKKIRLRVFINSMSDTFEDRRDLDSARNLLFLMAPCVPQLDLLLLTKRPENVLRMAPAAWSAEKGKWPANVWIGTTIEDQQQVEARIPELLSIPARVNFLSCEPLLGPIEIADYIHVLGHYFAHWVIAGGESGQSARPCDVAWLRSLRDQCALARVPFFLKQLGAVPMELEADWRGRVVTRLLNARNARRVPAGFVPLKFKDSHGGDLTEWPADLQIREFPQ